MRFDLWRDSICCLILMFCLSWACGSEDPLDKPLDEKDETTEVCTPSGNWVKHSIGIQEKAMYVYTMDMDRDKDLDLVVTSMVHQMTQQTEVAWYRNSGTSAAWEKHVISSVVRNPIENATGVIASDLDNDQVLDIVVATGLGSRGEVFWFRAQDSTLVQWDRYKVFSGETGQFFKVYTADVNRDGWLDIVAGGVNAAQLLLNPTAPTETASLWTAHQLPEGSGAFIFLDDLNNDGKIDLISSNYRSQVVSWTEMDVTGNSVDFKHHIVTENLVGAFDVYSIDINENGFKDLIVSRIMEPGVFWYEAPKDPLQAWKEHTISTKFQGADLYVGDIDQNGGPDFAISGVSMGGAASKANVSWFSTETKGEIWTEHTAFCFEPDAPGDLSLDDIDGDGDLDIVTVGHGTGEIMWIENKISVNRLRH